jgi:hypothetical protein
MAIISTLFILLVGVGGDPEHFEITDLFLAFSFLGIGISAFIKNSEIKPYLFYIIFGCFYFIGFFYICCSSLFLPNYSNEEILVKGTYSSRSYIQNKKHSSNENFCVALNEYPEFYFELTQTLISRVDMTNLLDSLNVNDSFFVNIDKDIYLKKIAKTKNPTFLEKHTYWKYIDVFFYKVLEI